jgi:hypothetical protein
VLKKAAALCSERDVAFVLAIAPDQALVESGLARDVLGLLWESGGLELSDRRRYEECRRSGSLRPLTVAPDLLSDLGAADRIRVVDLWEVFREAGSNGGLYLQRDTHWSRAGNELAASVLADTLSEVLQQREQHRRGGSDHGESKSNSPAMFDGGDSAPPAPRTVTR